MKPISDINILCAISSFFGDAQNVPPSLVVVNQTDVAAYNQQTLQQGDALVEYSRSNFSDSANIVDSVAAIPTYTGEEWLLFVEYTPLRLLTCLDLENKLSAVNLSSPKLAAVRSWIDTITFMASPNPDAKRNDWPSPPYSFAESTGEALQILQGA
jgi:hypothetical protein